MSSKSVHSFTSDWPGVLEEALPEEKRESFRKRMSAVCRRLDDCVTLSQAAEEYGFSREELHRLIKRCHQVHPDGRIWGFRALVPFVRVNDYTRQKPEIKICREEGKERGHAGLFKQLLGRHQELERSVVSLFLHGTTTKRGIRRRLTKLEIHSHFVALCSDLGIARDEYPLNTRDKGKRALYRYFHEYEYNNQSAVLRYRYGEKVAISYEDDAVDQMPKVSRPFELVELDGHEISAKGIVEIDQFFGPKIYRPVKSAWLVCAQEYESTAIVGYCFSLTGNYNANDVLRCVMSAMDPCEFDGDENYFLEKFDGRFLAVHFLPELSWVAWDTIALDRALQHRADHVRYVFVDVCNSVMKFSRAYRPKARPLIENLYKHIEDKVYKEIPSTGGAGPKDYRRANNPHAEAVRYRVTTQELDLLARKYICDYNNAPKKKLGGISPIQFLSRRVSERGFARRIPEVYRNRSSMLRFWDSRTVRGDPREGRRPHINFENGVYKGQVISRTRRYLGQDLEICGVVDDARVLTAYLNGVELDKLTVGPPWDKQPHSIETRRRAMEFFREANINQNGLHDAISTYHQMLSQRNIRHADTVLAKELARLEREQGTSNSSVVRGQILPEDKLGERARSSAVDKLPNRKALNL